MNENQSTKKRLSVLRKILRFVAHCIALAGIFFILLMPQNHYEWMCSEEEWGGSPPATCTIPEESSGDSALFVNMFLFAVICIQLILAASANNKREIVLSAVFIVLAVCVWGLG
ncbi:MAG: hypothetical protein LBG78_03485 [Azoarcus sp.]|jgi:hypothetical protein|nr:hypothetical protein [Azoarcus sp.]